MADTPTIPDGTKQWFTSKTIWVAAFTLVAAIAQSKWGYVAPPTAEMAFLAVVNAVLRYVTTTGIN